MREMKKQIRHSDPKGFIFRTPCPWAICPKKGGVTMKCYMLDYNQTLFPSIPVSKTPSDKQPPTWQIDLGSMGEGGELIHVPVPWNTTVFENLSNHNYGSVKEVPLVTGQYLVYIVDQSMANHSWHITCSDNHMVLAKAWSSHGDTFKGHGGPEYLCSMLPGDWFSITVNCETWTQPKVTLVIAGKTILQIVKPERVMQNKKSFLPLHLPSDGEAIA